MNKFYVYALLDSRKKGVFTYDKYTFDYEPFYIGKGSGDRINAHTQLKRKSSQKSTFKNNKIRKIVSEGNTIITCKVCENLTEENAYAIENELILLIGRYNNKTGVLTNLNDGGTGNTNHIMQNSSKLSISTNNAKYWEGKKLSQETIDKSRDKISQSLNHNSLKTKTYKVISPCGKEYIITDGLKYFCQKHNLSRTKMIGVAKGHKNHHKKWKCFIVEDKIMPKDKTYKLTNLVTNLFYIITDIRDFASKNDLSVKRLYEVSRNQHYCHKCWRCEFYNTP